MNKISFVILHYKDIATTKICIDSILRMEQQDKISIVVVDNDIQATDQERKLTIEKLSLADNITILPMTEGGGFSHGNNAGYRYARMQDKADCILVINNDIEFRQTDLLARLEDIDAKNPCHILGPEVIKRSNMEYQNPMDTRVRTLEEVDRTIRLNGFCLKYFDILYPLLSWKMDRDDKNNIEAKKKNQQFYEQVQEDIVPFGACFIFMPAFVKEEEAAFKPEPQFYYEEYLLALRSEKLGYKIVYDPQIKVWHESGTATKKSNKGKKQSLRFMMQRTLDAAKVYRQELLKS